ncbi:MAG: hypothetical protein ACPLRY_01430 [Candidatus Bathyarchaeales archaeon]
MYGFKRLWIMLLLASILVYISAYVPKACSQEQGTPDKALKILKDVIGFDLAAYKTRLDSCIQDMYFDTLPQENLRYALESDESKLEVIFAFVNGKLRSMSVYALEGMPLITRPATNVLEMAKETLSRYQTYCGASYCEAMNTMLYNVKVNENVTKVSGNIKFEATYEKVLLEWENRTVDSIGFRWTYTLNGVEAPSKCVALYFEDEFLKHFIDTWSLYKIGSSAINISEEEAVKIAMERTKSFSWKVSMGGDNIPIEVKEFNIAGVSETKLVFGNYIEKNQARMGDPLTLYPGWHIKLYFDKLYPGNVYGVEVAIWADTGEVHDIRTLFLMGYYPPNGDTNGENSNQVEPNEDYNNGTCLNLTQIAWIFVLISIAIVLGATKVCYKRKRKNLEGLHNLLKFNSLKLGGILAGFLLLPTLFSMATSTVKAGTYVMGLYGSRAGMVQAEQEAAKHVIDYMEYHFTTYAGYTCGDYYGYLTQKSLILWFASLFEQNYDHVAMFHHGHAGFKKIGGLYHYDYFDDNWDYNNPNYGDEIWDYDVYPQTSRSKHFFVIIWACRQGDIEGSYHSGVGARGMPFAWHHPVNHSYDCFIGFKDASIPLTQNSRHYPYVTYHAWIIAFIYYLTCQHYTIMQALDRASMDCFFLPYYQTELHNGFTADWPEYPGWPPMPPYSGKMWLYGNPDIRVY